jgi:uncharacterized protein (DUF1800 family)
MKFFCSPRLMAAFWVVIAGIAWNGAFAVAIMPARADEPPEDSAVPYTPLLQKIAGDTSVTGVTFLTKKTRLWLGRSQVICFYAPQSPDEDRFFSFSADEEYLHVLIPPTLLPGGHIGYIRVRPIKEGQTQITLEGVSMDIDVAQDTAASTLELTRPEIVSPVQGAAVWGKFVVGVEQLNFSTSAPGPAPVLRLPDGSEAEAQRVPNQQPGPHLRYAFTIDADSLQPGANELRAVFKDAMGQEIASDPVEVVALKPDDAAILSGNCKDQIQTQLPPPATPVPGPPKIFKPPTLIADSLSVYGDIVSCPGEYPPWCMPVNVPAKGLYQMMVTARGDIGGNALPSLGLMIDNAPNPATTTRLATTDWQRIPAGHPVTLEAGDHVLSVRFRNAFYGGSTDIRRLYLARYELARLDQLPAPALAANDAKTTMQDAAATPFNQQQQMAPTSGSAPMQMQPSMDAKPMAGSMMMQALAPYGTFHVVFKDALDGQMISNQVEIDAMTWWPDQEHFSPPPTVNLLVNDKVFASETSGQPRFHVDVSAFRPGSNKIRLQGTLPSGQHAQSVAETIVLPRELSSGHAFYQPRYKFDVYDPAWKGSLAARVHSREADPVAAFYENGDSALRLPEDLQGPYKVSVEAKGNDFNGPAVATLLLRANGQETKLGEVPTGANLAVIPVAQTTFAGGPKTLIVRFSNDAYQAGKGDRNLYLHSVRMDPVSNNPSKTPPVAFLAYPPPNAEVGLADAVVANVAGSQGVVHADLLIDGTPQHFNLAARDGFGPILFPLLTRDLSPGPHRLQISVRDDAGNIGQSGEVSVVVTGKEAAPGSAYARALHILNRFGYGPESSDLAAILVQGSHAWLESRLNETIDSPAEQNEEERLHAEFPNTYAIAPRAVQYLITDDNPVRARFLVWAENHFSTWVNKDGPAEKSREHDRFLELGVAPFSDLLLASATSPAMLIYLDQRNSVAKRLNENYAREIMELHTLGVKGGYTQKDVTSLADLLTGWTLADEAPSDGSQDLERTFRYDPYLNSGTPCRVLGMEFAGVPLEERFDRVLTALNMLSAHPSCAYFISRKLAEHYVSEPAPPKLVDDLAQIYLESGGDLRVMLLALSENPEFLAAPDKVASPIDFSVRLARLARLGYPGPVNDFVSRSGMGMFDRATPDGYPDSDGYFTSSNALLQRWRFALTIQNNLLADGLIPSDWRPADSQWDSATIQRLVDLAAVRITGNVLTANSNDAALQLIAAAPANTEQRLHLLATFLCQLPENSLR